METDYKAFKRRQCFTNFALREPYAFLLIIGDSPHVAGSYSQGKASVKAETTP